MKPTINIRKAIDIDATNAYYVDIHSPTGTESLTVHTSRLGRGLWIDGKQARGLLQFSAGKNPAAAIRRYFSRNS